MATNFMAAVDIPLTCTACERKEIFMFGVTPHKQYQSYKDAPDDMELVSLPVQPDEGPVPALIPDEPEHDRVIDPE